MGLLLASKERGCMWSVCCQSLMRKLTVRTGNSPPKDEVAATDGLRAGSVTPVVAFLCAPLAYGFADEDVCGEDEVE